MTDHHDLIENVDEEIELDEILPWAEFGAWASLVMTPIIWWLQGPSVSIDQYIVRTGLVVISTSVAVGLRARALIQRRRDAKPATADKAMTTTSERRA